MLLPLGTTMRHFCDLVIVPLLLANEGVQLFQHQAKVAM